jgi:hypothetical protein
MTTRKGAVVQLAFNDSQDADRAARLLTGGLVNHQRESVWIQQKWAPLAPAIVLVASMLLRNKIDFPLNVATAALFTSPLFFFGYRRALLGVDGVTIRGLRGPRVLRMDQLTNAIVDGSGVQIVLKTGETLRLRPPRHMNQYIVDYLNMRVRAMASSSSSGR